MCGSPLLPVEAMAADMEEGAESRWESLPLELLCLVLARLPLSALVRSALVCKHWRQAAAEAYDDDGHRSRSLPWLWATDSRDFHSLPDHRTYRLDMPEQILKGPRDGAARVDAIHEDWFVVKTSAKNKPYLYFLYNPFSRERIDPPPVHIHSPRSHFHDPRPRFAFTGNPGDPGCVAAFPKKALASAATWEGMRLAAGE